MTRRPVSVIVLLALIVGCGSQATTGGTPNGTTSATTTSTSNGGGGEGGTTTGTSTSGLGGSFGTGGFAGTPVRELPGLTSITFYERTGGTAPTAYQFTVDGPELTTRLEDPLAQDNHDIPGADTEYYDVYYSDKDGAFELDGSYLTISGVFLYALPAGGGLNLAEIGLGFSDDTEELGNYLASYVVLGDNSHEPSVGACIDGDLQTHTTMGNTVGSSDRLRLTLGFLSTSGPPPN